MATTKKKSPSSDLETKLQRIDALLAEVDPDARKSLKNGASDAAIAKLSKRVFGGKPVPADLATFFRWHDGQSKIASLHPDDNRTPMSIDGAIEAWNFLSDPSEEILQPWSKSWFPIFDNGAGDYVCMETAIKKAGSLVAYWHADEDRDTVFPNLSAWADDLIAALEKAAAKAKKAPKKAKITLDASRSKWTKLAKPPTKAQVEKKPIGTAYWFKKTFAMANKPLVCLYVKVEKGTEDTWRYRSGGTEVSETIGRLQELLDRKKPPEDYEWKKSDFSVAWDCKEDAFDKDNPSPVGLREGVIQVLSVK